MVDEKPTDDDLAKTQKLPAFTAGPGNRVDEQFKSDQQQIENLIRARVPVHEILSKLVLMIESQSPDMLGSILLLSADGDHVKHAVAPSLPENYVEAVDGMPIGPKNGSCGTAMWRGKSVIVTDIATDPLWEDYRELAVSVGMAACWSTPILSHKGKVLGSFAMYYRDKRGPNDFEQHLTDVATRLAARAIQESLFQI